MIDLLKSIARAVGFLLIIRKYQLKELKDKSFDQKLKDIFDKEIKQVDEFINDILSEGVKK